MEYRDSLDSGFVSYRFWRAQVFALGKAAGLSQTFAGRGVSLLQNDGKWTFIGTSYHEDFKLFGINDD